METPQPTDLSRPPADARLEAALRAEAARLRSLPAPHVAPRVRQTIRALRPAPPEESPPAIPTRVARSSLTWLGLAAAALLVIALWDATPAREDPADAARTGRWLAGVPLTDALRVPPLREVAPWLDGGPAPLLSRELEHPLLEEADRWKLDAERAAAVIVQPLLRSLLQLQLRPSLQDEGGAFGR